MVLLKGLLMILLFIMVLISSFSFVSADQKTGSEKTTQEKLSSLPKEMEIQIRNIVQQEIQHSLASVDVLKVLEQSEEYKDEKVRVERELKQRGQQLKTLEETLMRKKEELEKLGMTLNEAAREQRYEELVSLEAQYRTKMQNAQEYAGNAEQKVRMNILKGIQEESEALAKEEGYIVVLSSGPMGGVIYGARSIDMTEKIVARLNAKYKAKQQKKEKETKAAEASQTPAKK